MKSDRGKSDFRKYPKLLKAVIRAVHDYIDTHPACSAKKKFGDAYGTLFNDLFCDSYLQFESRVHPPLFPEGVINPREYMSNYFGIEL